MTFVDSQFSIASISLEVLLKGGTQGHWLSKSKNVLSTYHIKYVVLTFILCTYISTYVSDSIGTSKDVNKVEIACSNLDPLQSVCKRFL